MYTCARTQARLEQQRAATARGTDTDVGNSACLFSSTQSTTFSTSNARTLLYPLPEILIPLNPPSPRPNIPQNSSQTASSAVLLFHTDQHNRVHKSEKVPRSLRSFRKIGGKEAMQQSPSRWARRTPSPRMHNVTVLFTRNQRSTKNNHTLQQPITPSWQHATKTKLKTTAEWGWVFTSCDVATDDGNVVVDNLLNSILIVFPVHISSVSNIQRRILRSVPFVILFDMGNRGLCLSSSRCVGKCVILFVWQVQFQHTRRESSLYKCAGKCRGGGKCL